MSPALTSQTRSAEHCRASDLSALTDLSVGYAAPTCSGLDDAALLDRRRSLAEIRRRVDAAAAATAGEIAYRSRRELGLGGLARGLGARTPEVLVQRLTGTSAREARMLARVGSLITRESPAAAVDDPSIDGAGSEGLGVEGGRGVAIPPWLRKVAAAVRAGELSIAAADVIGLSLGTDDRVAAAELTEAADLLLDEARTSPVDQIAIRARQVRADLDRAGARKRVDAMRERRYLHLTRQPDGMTRISGLIDPESAAIVGASYDAATSPRRGGPRFVDPEVRRRADELVADTRSTGQVALDTLVDPIDLATKAEPGRLFGSRRPPVQILVTAKDLVTGHGPAFLEGQSEAIAVATAERHVCSEGAIPVQFDDDGRAVRLGRRVRLFTAAQRQVMTPRDGGCLIPDCARPPSWTETHLARIGT